MKKFGIDFLSTIPISLEANLGPDVVVVDIVEYNRLMDTLNNLYNLCQDHITLTEAAADTSSDRVRSKANLMNSGYKMVLNKLNKTLGNKAI